MALHMIKLCVGCDTVDDLLTWRLTWRRAGAFAGVSDDIESAQSGQPWILRTRQTPKRAGELCDGGSLYRVFKGFILARQRILTVETVGEGDARRCEITLDEHLTLTAPTPRRAFQGWRYLPDADAPPDIGEADVPGAAPPDLMRKLREAGVW